MVNDSVLMKRMEKILENLEFQILPVYSKPNEAVVDVNQMTKKLQDTYPEYADCDLIAFRMLVNRVFIKLSAKIYENRNHPIENNGDEDADEDDMMAEILNDSESTDSSVFYEDSDYDDDNVSTDTNDYNTEEESEIEAGAMRLPQEDGNQSDQ